jgi:hypothetical protein
MVFAFLLTGESIMPAPDGTLSEDEVALIRFKLTQFFDSIGGRRPCPTCGTIPYWIIPQLNGNRSDTLTPNEAHYRYPTVMVTCQNCGYVEQYAATKLGIQYLEVPAPPPVPPPPTYIPPPTPIPAPPARSLGDILGEELTRRDRDDG